MFDPKLYREACDRMVLSAEKMEEMITMTENTSKKTIRHPSRVAMVAAALVAALGITASAAELPAVQEFFASVFVTVTVADGTFEGLSVPTMAVEKREGRTLLILDQEEIDVTDALAKDGEYLYEGKGYEVRVDADGVAVLTAYDDGGGNILSFSVAPNAGDGPVTYNVMAEGDEDPAVQTGVFNIVTDGSGSVDVIDEEGQVHNYTMKDGELIPGK